MSWTIWLIIIFVGLAILYIALKYFRVGALEALATKINEVVEEDKRKKEEDAKRFLEQQITQRYVPMKAPQTITSSRYIPQSYVHPQNAPCHYDSNHTAVSYIPSGCSGEVVIPQPSRLEDYNRIPTGPTGLPRYPPPNLMKGWARDSANFQNRIDSPEVGQKKQTRKRKVSKGEAICRETMTRITGKPFESARPDWLRNPETGKNLELDCYNEELRIAIEYNGQQHYEDGHFGMTEQETIEQWRRDQFKIDMCRQYGVYLIVVPYTVPHNQIADFILSNLPPNVFQYAF